VAQRKEPAAIKVISTLSAGLEAKLVVSYIRRVLQATPGLLFRDIGVLYRTNAQSLPLQVEFILNDIPYYVREEDNLLENRLLARLLATLRVKLALSAGQQPSPQDSVGIVQSFFSTVTPEESAAMLTLLTTNARFFEALNSEAFYTIIPKARAGSLVSAIHELLRTRTLMESLDFLAKNFNGLAGMVGSLEDVVAERTPLGEVYELAANFAGKTDDFVRMLERAVDRARQTKAGTNREGGVALLTYLRAKGMQWHTVILTTCNEGLLPHRRASIEDERRLFYVAITRASSNLLLSYVKSSCRTSLEPTRFLREAGLI
jgi:DNA helicase-2/ATP-dependent DNA helicase PcrA